MKALTIGGATVDSIAIVESDRIERMTMRNADTSFLLLEMGSKTEASEVSNHCGGGAVNAAVTMARLGTEVSIIARLGQDQRAETILAKLAAEGVSTRWCTRDERAPTGASVLISSHDRDAVIFTFRGANTLLGPADLQQKAFGVDLVYVSHLSNESADCFPEIVLRARRANAFVATNPGVRQLTARSAGVLDALANIDMLSVNRSEADAMVPALATRFGEGGVSLPLAPGEEPPAIVMRGFKAGGFEMSVSHFFSALHRLGLETVIVTDGAAGAIASSPASGIVFCPTPRAEAAGTAGAGDAYAATSALYLAEKQGLAQAMRAGAINAASVIGFADTQSGLLGRPALQSRLGEAGEALRLREWPHLA